MFIPPNNGTCARNSIHREWSKQMGISKLFVLYGNIDTDRRIQSIYEMHRNKNILRKLQKLKYHRENNRRIVRC
jgi:hypothetical protein